MDLLPDGCLAGSCSSAQRVQETSSAWAAGPPPHAPHAPFEIIVSSFAFKTGTPEANFVLDVRFLPDPRPLMAENPSLHGSVKHEAVEEYIRAQGCFDQFFEQLKKQTVSVVSECRGRGGQQCHLAFGCTAGLQRSVFVAERLAAWMRNEPEMGEVCVHVHHRETTGCPDLGCLLSSPVAVPDRFDVSSSSRSYSSSCSNSPSSSQLSSFDAAGPSLRAIYHPNDNSLHVEEDVAVGMRCSLSSEHMGSVLASGLNSLRALRARRGSCPNFGSV